MWRVFPARRQRRPKGLRNRTESGCNSVKKAGTPAWPRSIRQDSCKAPAGGLSGGGGAAAHRTLRRAADRVSQRKSGCNSVKEDAARRRFVFVNGCEAPAGGRPDRGRAAAQGWERRGSGQRTRAGRNSLKKKQGLCAAGFVLSKCPMTREARRAADGGVAFALWRPLQRPLRCIMLRLRGNSPKPL